MFLKNTVVYLTDAGTEKGIARIQPIAVGEALPAFEDTAQQQGQVDKKCHEDEWPDSDVEASVLETTSWLDISGPSHMLHGVTNDLGKVMTHFEDTVDKMGDICRLIRRPHSRQRMLARCFSCSVGRQFHKDFHSFRGHVQRGRWGTVAIAALELRSIEKQLRWGWDMSKYGASANDDNQTQQESGYKAVRVAVVSDAVKSPFFVA